MTGFSRSSLDQETVVSNGLERKRVCFIAGTLGQGGAERQLYYMLKVLRNAGSFPTVLCLTQGEFWEEPIRKLGVPVIFVGQSQSRLARLARIIREARRLRPHILQSQHFYTNLYVALASRSLGVPGVAALRNDCFSEVAATGRILGTLSLRIPALFVANSYKGIENAKRMGVAERKLFFLPNAIDVEQFRPERRNKQTTLTVLTAGRLVEQKRMDRFIRLIARLKFERSQPVRGLIVGDGHLLHSLRKQTQLLGLTERDIEFRGIVADMRAVYAEADVFVLTSDWEGTPNVVLEAMASGLPVVATNVGGVPEIVTDSVSGILVPVGDDERLIGAVMRLAADSSYRLRLANNARASIVSIASLEKMKSSLTAIYARILDGHELPDREAH